MAYSKYAIVSLVALTLQYSVLSLVLYASTHARTGAVSKKYHPASAVALTELCKITVSLLLVWLTGELSQVAKKGRAGKPVLKTYRTASEQYTALDTGDEPELYPPVHSPIDVDGRPTFVASDIASLTWWSVLVHNVFRNHFWMLLIPSVLFVFQGNAQYVASSNLSVLLFQLAYQLKIPATALCSVLLLKRALSLLQWFSILVLTSGVGIVQYGTTSVAPQQQPAKQAQGEVQLPNPLIGLTAVILASLSSGFASTYFERMLKSKPTAEQVEPNRDTPTKDWQRLDKPSLWIRNIQLSIFGFLLSVPLILVNARQHYLEQSMFSPSMDVTEHMDSAGDAPPWAFMYLSMAKAVPESFFQGFTSLTWLVILLQVSGGLIGALVMQHADNIAKCFSTSLSILISFAASVVFFDFQVTPLVLLGSFMVIGSTWTFSFK